MRNEKRRMKNEESKTRRLRAVSKQRFNLLLFFFLLFSLFSYVFTACDEPNDNGNGNDEFVYIPGTYLLTTQWNQGEPFNNETPVINNERSRAGCVIIAFAQIMKYHEHPNGMLSGTIPEYLSNISGGHSIPSVNLDGFTFDWSNMANTYNADSAAIQIKAVADLVNIFGRAVKAHFSGSSGGEVTSRFIYPALIRHFGYDPSIENIKRINYNDNEWINLLKQQIDQGLPVYYAGENADGSVDHGFVLDGYNDAGQFHINWGWGGDHDGFYYLNDLTPGSYNFNFNQEAIINIKPGTYHLEGNGTENNPYIIYSANDLAFAAGQVNAENPAYASAYYKLNNDITLTMKNWWGIGLNEAIPFKGVFDGNGKVIRGLSINKTNSYGGLFNYIIGGIVKNMGLEDVEIKGPTDLGGIVGRIDTNSAILNCYVSGTVVGTGSRIGGIVGRSDSSIISNCYSTAAVSGDTYAGGIAGVFQNGSTIENCAALGLSVAGTSNVGRVTGTAGAGNGTWTNNVAFAGMLNADNTTDWNNKTLTANSGLDITAAQITADGTLSNRFTAPVWTTQNGKLPGFGQARDLPEHLNN